MYENTTKTDRNKFVTAHLVAGKSLKEVQQLLLDGGYGKIDVTRVWKIWKKDSSFIAKRPKERHCAFCLERRSSTDMYSVIKNYIVLAKMCEDCWDKRPTEPTNKERE